MKSSLNSKYYQQKIQYQVLSVQLIRHDTILVTWPFGNFSEAANTLMKKFNGYWDYECKGWLCSIHQYKGILPHLLNQKSLGVTVEIIPKIAELAILPIGNELVFIRDNQEYRIDYFKTNRFSKIEFSLSRENFNRLYEFQKAGVQFGVENCGRILIADEMGIGKTIQALCIASCFQTAWPLLIICPSSLKYNWKEEILRWIPFIHESEIQIYVKSTDKLNPRTKILICSYDILIHENALNTIFSFKAGMAIADEAHYLKNQLAKRTQKIVPYLQLLQHVILLTGTPVFARPIELFPLLSIIRPDIFSDFEPFGQRYCNYNVDKFNSDYSNSKNEKELHFILKQTIMLRRLKSDVLSELPTKRRKKIIVTIDINQKDKIQTIFQKYSKTNLEKTVVNALKAQALYEKQPDEYYQKYEKKTIAFYAELAEIYKLSGVAKFKELQNYILNLLKNDTKIIIFAYHQDMMNKIEEFVKQNRYEFIRIDGNVLPKERSDRITLFQLRKEIKVAILSLSASCFGFNLVASSNVVFAEMHWTPAIMFQAEDRAHRIGQEDSVLCHYIIGQNTFDEILYKKLEKKLSIATKILNGEPTKFKMDYVETIQSNIPKLILQPTKVEEQHGIKQEDVQTGVKLETNIDIESCGSVKQETETAIGEKNKSYNLGKLIPKQIFDQEMTSSILQDITNSQNSNKKPLANRGFSTGFQFIDQAIKSNCEVENLDDKTTVDKSNTRPKTQKQFLEDKILRTKSGVQIEQQSNGLFKLSFQNGDILYASSYDENNESQYFVDSLSESSDCECTIQEELTERNNIAESLDETNKINKEVKASHSVS